MMWGKVDSWDVYSCSWCEEIRYKYAIRFRIANEVGLNDDVLQKFDNLRRFATCPLHRELTVHPAHAKSIRKFEIKFVDDYNQKYVEYKDGDEIIFIPAVVFEWWSNINTYKAIWTLDDNKIEFWKNDEFIATLTNHNLIAELLTLCSKEELEAIENFIRKHKEKLKEMQTEKV